jgi:CDP-glucose 4,6-dehydratase
MESITSCFAGAFRDKNVWVSGHTGFKGAWLCEWLLMLGARVHGFSQEPPTNPSLYNQLELRNYLATDERGDIRNADSVLRSLAAAAPEYVFHLAAQPLVRLSYDRPEVTWATNVNGTIHVLEGLRMVKHPCSAVIVTSDKCYENQETGRAYPEEDSLGGFDPYSASKGAVEVAVAAWRRSFFLKGSVQIASARAGNVIGGGDWAQDRIIPDCVRALRNGAPIGIRNKNAVRPWQHVLEPLSGYLWLAASMGTARWKPAHPELASASAFNFGPTDESSRSVGNLVEEVLKHWTGTWVDQSDPTAVHEAHLLGLATEKARLQLGWKPVWEFSDAVLHTVQWYQRAFDGKSTQEVTQSEIRDFGRSAALKSLEWSGPSLRRGI